MRPACAFERHSRRARSRRRKAECGHSEPHQLHAAEVRSVRRPERDGKPESLRRPARRVRRDAENALLPPAGHDRSCPLHGASRGQALRRHEAEAGPGLHAGALAGAAAARRTFRGRGSAFPAGAVGHHCRHGEGGEALRHREHGLHGRGRALRSRGGSARRQAAGSGHAGRTAPTDRRALLRLRRSARREGAPTSGLAARSALARHGRRARRQPRALRARARMRQKRHSGSAACPFRRRASPSARRLPPRRSPPRRQLHVSSPAQGQPRARRLFRRRRRLARGRRRSPRHRLRNT